MLEFFASKVSHYEKFPLQSSKADKILHFNKINYILVLKCKLFKALNILKTLLSFVSRSNFPALAVEASYKIVKISFKRLLRSPTRASIKSNLFQSSSQYFCNPKPIDFIQHSVI